jgi:hypothetical protein
VHYPGAGPEIRQQVTGDLRMPSVLWPQVQFTGGEIYHVSLAVGPADGVLPDEKWERISHEFMQGMRLEDPAKAPIRWTAVRHGLSAEGNDHVHLVVNLIREDGTKASIWQDRVQAQKVVAQIEQNQHLTVLQSRLSPVGAGSVPYSQGEAIEAKRTGEPLGRVELERRVRAAATAARTEAEFVSLLRGSDVLVRPYPLKSGAVTGYSVALPGVSGQRNGRYFAGGELARDLSLPRIRSLWPDAGGSQAAALDQWRPGAGAAAPVVPGSIGPADLEAAQQALLGLDVDLALASPEEFVELSSDLAGATAAAASVAPADQQAQLAAASREIGGWAGTRRPVARSGPARTQLVALALLHSLSPDSELSRAFIQRQLIQMLIELVQSHRAARPMVKSPGRGALMSQGQDDLDAVFGDTITTVGMSASMAVAAKQHRKVAAATASRTRFSRFRPSEDDHRIVRDPVPIGFRDVFDQDDYATLSPDQRSNLDPDRIGRWHTDIDPQRPETGPGLPATATQVQVAGRLGEHLGEPGKGGEVAALTRTQGAKLIRQLEARIPPDDLRGLYHEQGLAYRVVQGGHVRYELPDSTVFPVPEASGAAVRRADAGRGPVGGGRPEAPPEDWLLRPLEWHSGPDAVTPKQTYRLHQLGVGNDAISQLDKGWASAVLTAYERGDQEGQGMLNRALAAVERSTPPAMGNTPKLQQPGHKGPSRQ